MVLGFLLSDYLNKDFSFFNITGTKVEKYDFSFYIYELFKNINLNVTNQPYDVIFYRWNSKYEKFCRFISELFHFEYQGSIENAIQNSIVAIEEWSCPLVAFETLLSEKSKRIARLIFKTIITRYRDWPHNTILELVDSLTKETELEIKTVVKKENGDEAFFKMIRELDRSDVIKDKVNQRDAVLEETRKLVPASAYWLWNRGDFDSLVNSTEIVKQGHVPCNKDCERCNNRCMIGLKKYGFKNVSI